MPDVSALVQQMQQTLTAIHETITSLDPKVHDEKLDALEAERDDILAKLLAAFEKESAELTEKRKHERDEIAEKRRKEDEEIAARRKREDEELNSRDLTNDSEREQKLEAEKHHVEESTDSKMEQVEDEAQRAMDEAHEKLRELEGKRQDIHRSIDEQMKVPLPAPPKRKRRGTAKPAQNGTVVTTEASQPESRERSVAVEAQDPSEPAAEQEAAKDVAPAGPKQEANVSEELAVEVEEAAQSQPNEQATHPNSSEEAKESASEEIAVQEVTRAEAPQSEGPTVAEASEEAPIETGVTAEEPSAENLTATSTEPAPEMNAEDVSSSKEVPEQTAVETSPAEPSTERELKLEDTTPSEPTADAPVANNSEAPEKPVAEERSTEGVVSEKLEPEDASAEEAPAKEVAVENAETDIVATGQADSQDPHPEDAPVESSATQDPTETKEPPHNDEVSTSQSRDLGNQPGSTSDEAPRQVQHAAEDQQAGNAPSATDDESKPRDLDAKQENLPDSEDTEPAAKSVLVEAKAEAEPETAHDAPEESSALVQHSADENDDPAEKTEDQGAKEGVKTSESIPEAMEQSKSPSGPGESAWLSGKTSLREAVVQEEPTGEADPPHQESPAGDLTTDSNQQEHVEVAAEEAENNATTTGIVEGSAAEEYLETAKAEAEPQHNSSEPPKSDHLPPDDGQVSDTQAESSHAATQDSEKPSSDEKPPVKEEPTTLDHPQERDLTAAHEGQPENSELQSGETAQDTPMDAEVGQPEEKLKAEEHSGEGQHHTDVVAGESHTDSAEKSSGDSQPVQHLEPEPEHEPEHKSSETTHQDPKPEQAAAPQDKSHDDEDSKDTEQALVDDTNNRISHEAASISGRDVEAPAEETKARDAPVAQGPFEEKTKEIPETAASGQVQSSELAEEKPMDGPHPEAAASDESSAAAPTEKELTGSSANEDPSADAPDAGDSTVETTTDKEPAQSPAAEEPIVEEPAKEDSTNEEPGKEEPATKILATEAPATEEPAEDESPEEELATQSSEITNGVEETQSRMPAAEGEAVNHTQDTAQHSTEKKTVESPHGASTTETPQNEPLQPDTASSEAPVDAPVQPSVEQTGVPHAADTSAEVAVEKPAPEHVTESFTPGDDSVSPNNGVLEETHTVGAHEDEQGVQVDAESEKTSQQDSGSNNEPQEVNRDDHVKASDEPNVTEDPSSLPIESKEIIHSDEQASDGHDIGEKMSDSGYDSALTGSRTLDDATSVPGQHQHEEALAAVQEDIRPTDEPHSAAQQLEAEIQDHKEQPEIHEGAGNVISPSKGGDVQESGNFQAAETLEDGASERGTDGMEREADNIEDPKTGAAAAEHTKAAATDQPPISSERAGRQDDDPSQVQRDTAPSGIEENPPESTNGSNVQGDNVSKSHEDKEGNSLKGDSEQTVFEGTAIMPTETDQGVTNDSQEVSNSGGKSSESLERDLSRTETTESGQLVQEQPQQDTIGNQQARVPAVAVNDKGPSDKAHEEVQEPSHENPREELESHDAETTQPVSEEVPQASSSSRRESRPTIDTTTRTAHDDPDEGLFAVPPTPRQEVDKEKPERIRDEDVKHERPEGTIDAPLDLSASRLDAGEIDSKMEPPQQERTVDAGIPPKADLPDDKSPEAPVKTEQPDNMDEPQGEQYHLTERDAMNRQQPASAIEHASTSSLSDSDGYPQTEVPETPQVHDSQPKSEIIDAPTSQGQDEDTHASEVDHNGDTQDDRVHTTGDSEIKEEAPGATTTMDHEATDPRYSPEEADFHDRGVAVEEPRASDVASPVEKNLNGSANLGPQADTVDNSPQDHASSAAEHEEPSYGGHVAEDSHGSAQYAAHAPSHKVESSYGGEEHEIDEPHEKYHAHGDDASQQDDDAGSFSHIATASKHEVDATSAPSETDDTELKAQSAAIHAPDSTIEQQQQHGLGTDPEKFEQALGHLPDESAHTVQGTDQLFDDDYEDESTSEYGEAVVNPPERIIYQAHGDDSNVALGGNRSSLSLGRNSIESARSLGHRSRESRGSIGSVQPTTPVRLTDGSYLPGANIVRADWAAEHEEELRPSHRGTPLLEPSTAQDTAEISPFALRNASPTEDAMEERGLSSSRWNTERPSTPPPVPSKKFNNPFRFQRTPEPAAEPELVPRDVTNVPWHARQDSVPVSLHSQTTVSSVTSSPIHSALPADKHEPVIRDSWAAPPPGYQQYLSSWTGRTRGDSAVSNNSDYDPFRSDAIVGGTPVKSSIYNPLQQRARGESSVSAAPSNTSATASNASPGRGSALFQKMRNIFESQSGPDPNASMEPMRSPYRRPPSGASHPVTPMQRTSSERLRAEAYDPPAQHHEGSQNEAENEPDERIAMLRSKGVSYEADHATY